MYSLEGTSGAPQSNLQLNAGLVKRENLAGLYPVRFQKFSCLQAAKHLGATCSTAALSCGTRGIFSSPLWTSQLSLGPLSLLSPPCTAVGSLVLSSQCPTCSKGKVALRCCQNLPFSLLKQPYPSASFWGAHALAPDLSILVVLHRLTPVWQYLSVPLHGVQVVKKDIGKDFAFVLAEFLTIPISPLVQPV